MTYDYQCKKCNRVEEHQHGMTEKPTIKCQCGQVMVKLFSKPLGVHGANTGARKGT